MCHTPQHDLSALYVVYYTSTLQPNKQDILKLKSSRNHKNIKEISSLLARNSYVSVVHQLTLATATYLHTSSSNICTQMHAQIEHTFTHLQDLISIYTLASVRINSTGMLYLCMHLATSI